GLAGSEQTRTVIDRPLPVSIIHPGATSTRAASASDRGSSRKRPGRRKAARRRTAGGLMVHGAAVQADMMSMPLFGGRLVGLLARARPGIEELAPIGPGDVLGDAIFLGPAILGQVEGSEKLVEPGEMDREIHI